MAYFISGLKDYILSVPDFYIVQLVKLSYIDLNRWKDSTQKLGEGGGGGGGNMKIIQFKM